VAPAAACPLCAADGGVLVARTARLRLVRADEPGLPAFYRVVWNAHVAEFSDLPPSERRHCMDAVVAVEQVLREQLRPDKVNLAAFGNLVPHLHWHVVARWQADPHWPQPVWAPAQRPPDPALAARVHAARPALEQLLAQRLQALAG
jgi:diadenosine tetraphosphate (Ap4A) HIT family hydrolase